MRRAGFFAIYLFLCPIILKAQYKWFKTLNGDGDVVVVKVCIQPTGNIVAIGSYQNGLNLEGESFTGAGAFILCYNPEGALQWRQVFPSPINLNRVDTDGQGNLYVSGMYLADAQIGPLHLTGSGYSSFLAKFDPTGNVLWIDNFPGLQEIIDMDANSQGNVALTSYLSGTVAITGTTLSSGFAALFAVFDSNGFLKWARLFSSNLTFYSSWPTSVAIDNSNNVFGDGKFSGSLTLDGHTIAGSGNYSIFFARLNSTGGCDWLTSANRTVPPEYEPSSPPNGLVVEHGDLAPDEHGGVVAYGEYYLSMNIGGINLPNDVDNPYAANFFLLKLKNDGSVDWANGILTQGQFESAENLVEQNEKFLTSGVENNQFYFASYSKAGQPVGDRVILNLYADIANGLALTADDSLYLAGRSVTQWDDPPTFGFVLKYGKRISPSPDTPGPISSPDSICLTSQIKISTSIVSNADGYQWFIDAGGFTRSISTTAPSVQFTPKDLGIRDEFNIQVRAFEQGDTSAYTNPVEVIVVDPPATPTLSADCLSIKVTEGASGEWYLNGEEFNGFPNDQTKVYPSLSGSYYYQVSNFCGSAHSNIIDFSPFQVNPGMIPNVFTPNDDMVNDFFVLDKRLEGSSLTVFSRDGAPVFNSPSYFNNWNGVGLPTGVYFYLIRTSCQTDPIKGIVSILR